MFWLISSDVNTIFRGNSLLSKCIDELMKLVGLRYLHDTLNACIEKVILENRPCEIDPSRNKIDSFETNLNNLKHYTSLFFKAIISSTSRCPQVMCEIFSVLKELAINFFPDNKEVCYYVISGFVFLRFFAPAILNPKLFELTDHNIVRLINLVLFLKLIVFLFVQIESSNESNIHSYFENNSKYWKFSCFEKGILKKNLIFNFDVFFVEFRTLQSSKKTI